jgi:hypothetical protein
MTEHTEDLTMHTGWMKPTGAFLLSLLLAGIAAPAHAYHELEPQAPLLPIEGYHDPAGPQAPLAPGGGPAGVTP